MFSWSPMSCSIFEQREWLIFLPVDADQAPGAAEIDVRKERLPLFGAILSRVNASVCG
jgi:hypothetical protein